MKRGVRFFIGVVACLAACTVGVAAATLDEFRGVIASIPVANESRIMAALALGQRSGFPADETYRLFERVAGVTGAAADKEAILLVVVEAIESGLPVDSLLNKAFEGLARGVSLSTLGHLLDVRLRLLEGTSDLFGRCRIFRASQGAVVAAGSTALAPSVFDALLSNVGDALGDYVESGGSPLESQRIYNQVEARLTLLAGTAFSADDVELVLSRVEPADLTRVVLAALS